MLVSPICMVLWIVLAFILFRSTKTLNSPVLIYGVSSNERRPVFPTIKIQEFTQMMQKLARKHILIAFLEENFSAKKLRCKSHSFGECFGDLPVENHFTYYGSVEDPFDALVSVVNHNIDYIEEEGIGSHCDYGKTLHIIKSSSRDQNDRSLLALRAPTIKNLTEFYVKQCNQLPIFFFINEPSSMMSSKIIEENILRNKKGTYNLTIKEVTTAISEEILVTDLATESNGMFSIIQGKPKVITFEISQRPGYKNIYDLEYGGIKYHGYDIKWNKGSSFSQDGLALRSGNRLLRINSFERITNDPKNTKQNQKRTTVYQTPGTISGLFISAILCSVIYWGISMIMDIKANDRYEDNSKPFEISVSD